VKTTNSLQWRTLLFWGSLCTVTVTNAQTLDLEIGTELECDLSVLVWSKSGSCPSTAGPYYPQCVNISGPGYTPFSVPAPYPNVYQMDLYCGLGCTGTPIAVWACAAGTTEGECCGETIGMYGDQDPTNGWRIY
jgi:hypothetical protein